MADPKPVPDLAKLLSDPAFQGDRDLFNGLIDARLTHHATEAEKRRKENQPDNLFDVLFGGARKPKE